MIDQSPWTSSNGRHGVHPDAGAPAHGHRFAPYDPPPAESRDGSPLAGNGVSANGNGHARVGRLSSLWNWMRGRSDKDVSLPQGVDQDGDHSGVHGITKATNYWFERELHDLERDTTQLAADWAAQGLPRHDVIQSEPLPPEVFIASKCVAVFRGWLDRVRVKMQDAIALEVRTIGERVGQVRNAAARLQAIHVETRDVDEKIESLRAVAASDNSQIGYEPLAGGRVLFWSFAALLAAVEFAANFPVFRLLLPMNAAFATAAREAAEEIDTSSWIAPVALQLKEVLMHIEAAVVAFVVVLILVLLSKTIGTSLRPLFALHEKDHPLAAGTVRRFRQQNQTLAAICFVGVVAVLTGVWFARTSIAEVTGKRVEQLQVRLDSADTRSAAIAADTTSTRPERSNAQQFARDLRREHQAVERELTYAQTVENINLPILALNIGLVLAAAALGFMTHRADLTNRKGEHPGIAELKQHRVALLAEAVERNSAGRQAESEARAGIARVQHLLSSSPLREWKAKSQRLDGVMHLFRTVNAHRRSLDPASILAFRSAPPLELPVIEAQDGFPEPEEFARVRSDFAEAAAAFHRESPRVTPVSSMRAVGT